LFLSRQPKFGIARDIWQTARDRQMQEYRRLFYVALTRAEKQLFICGWMGGKSKAAPVESWYALAASALVPLHQPELAITEPAPEIVMGEAILPSAATPDSKPKTPAILPAWAAQSLPLSSTTPSMAPSQVSLDTSAATPDFAFARGRIIHRLLQSIPSIAPNKRAAAVARYLGSPQHELTQPQRDEIATETLKLLENPDFAALFAPDSLAEAPVTGKLNGTPVFRQIDRLCQRGDEILIVDYKTNRPPPRHEKDIAPSYRQQLGEYRALMTQIWPDKRIRCFLLWTYTAELMEVSF
jgi:ATP-dependent helicase/nuclease subunit A